MKSNSYKIIGAVFLLLSGIIYSLERVSTLISTSMIRAGFFSGRMTGEVPSVETANFFDNLFAPLFLLIGLVSIIYGFKREK
ncbi:hypothetical protein [Paenibacillus camelliae]|uniref:hypothetical protein n=1 Tax=Paenibacillus camelliae TaxID=512410 RepID=UPI00203D0F46|nr:hypothetical protein [Paenibacillus camelliae]MCM3632888.1 hypothetical protein [Paenibacillus camelliae]